MKEKKYIPAKLEFSEVWNRMMRRDAFEELGVSTTKKIIEAIDNNDTELAKELVNYQKEEWKLLHDLYASWVYQLLDWISTTHGEEEVHLALRDSAEFLTKTVYHNNQKVDALEMVYRNSEGMRSHPTGPEEMGDITINDEGDKYVMEFAPCGSGQRMRRETLDGRPALTDDPFNLGKTKQAYSWSAGHSDVPYYCLHCFIFHEIIPTEKRGYPVKITEFNPDPDKPCKWLYYKDPKDIPKEYFERIGKLDSYYKLHEND